jgi:hypothetical protein
MSNKVNTEVYLKEWSDNFWSDEVNENIISKYKEYCSAYSLLKKAKLEDYIREVRAINLQLFTIAWHKSVKRKFQLDVYVFKAKDEALKIMDKIGQAYNDSIPDSVNNGGDSIHAFIDIMLRRLLPEADYNTVDFKELTEAFYGDFNQQYNELCRHLKSIKLTRK